MKFYVIAFSNFVFENGPLKSRSPRISPSCLLFKFDIKISDILEIFLTFFSMISYNVWMYSFSLPLFCYAAIFLRNVARCWTDREFFSSPFLSYCFNLSILISLLAKYFFKVVGRRPRLPGTEGEMGF